MSRGNVQSIDIGFSQYAKDGGGVKRNPAKREGKGRLQKRLFRQRSEFDGERTAQR